MPMVRAGGFLTGKIWGAGAVLLRITRTLPGVNKPTKAMAVQVDFCRGGRAPGLFPFFWIGKKLGYIVKNAAGFLMKNSDFVHKR